MVSPVVSRVPVLRNAKEHRLPAARSFAILLPSTMATHESSSAKRALSTRRGPHAPKHIVIEGPLRVGKSTLARVLAERLHARRVYDCEDNPFLCEFYSEKPGSALRVQMYFLMERQKRMREALAVGSPAPPLSPFLVEEELILAQLELDYAEAETYQR